MTKTALEVEDVTLCGQWLARSRNSPRKQVLWLGWAVLRGQEEEDPSAPGLCEAHGEQNSTPRNTRIKESLYWGERMYDDRDEILMKENAKKIPARSIRIECVESIL
ncbi:MAG: uncharacterized protein A8A55_3028 [Amphiamblys sp. WSBS2006]|nr:MAG: uncharacterized protein A8A55_3028 [Amphiamblys sp. WSBS2006]